MRIFIDIGHPAHVHYFKTFIKLMSEKGHEFYVSARDKEVTFKLLQEYNIPYSSRGKGGKGFVGKILYLFKGDWIVYQASKRFKPDIFLSFASPYAAHASFLLSRPHIAFDDTEVAKFGQLFYLPFTNVCVNPKSFQKSFGKKQIRFDGFIELCSLHPNYFKPDPSVLQNLDIDSVKPFVLIRFVSWNANHDMGQNGFSYENKIELIKNLKEKYTILISSESVLPKEFNEYKINVSPEKIHHVMAFASLFIGEGATMASECAMLGTPAIYVNSITAGTLEEQEKYGLLYGFRNGKGVLEKALELLNNPMLKEEFQKRRHTMLNEKIDVTAFMVWFIENFPASIDIIKKNPEHQYNLK